MIFRLIILLHAILSDYYYSDLDYILNKQCTQIRRNVIKQLTCLTNTFKKDFCVNKIKEIFRWIYFQLIPRTEDLFSRHSKFSNLYNFLENVYQVYVFCIVPHLIHMIKDIFIMYWQLSSFYHKSSKSRMITKFCINLNDNINVEFGNQSKIRNRDKITHRINKRRNLLVPSEHFR